MTMSSPVKHNPVVVRSAGAVNVLQRPIPPRPLNTMRQVRTHRTYITRTDKTMRLAPHSMPVPLRVSRYPVNLHRPTIRQLPQFTESTQRRHLRNQSIHPRALIHHRVLMLSHSPGTVHSYNRAVQSRLLSIRPK